MKWHTEQRKISDLNPTEHNPRQLTKKQFEDLKKSLLKFDLAEIPAINTTNQILAGHQRLTIMGILGRSNELIDVRIPDRELSKKECDEYIVRSNKNTGEWNMDVLADSFDLDELKEWGFEDKDFGIETSLGAEDDGYEIQDEIKTDIVLGDLIEIGDHRLICGDSTATDTFAKLYGDQLADMIITDPPYNVAIQGGNHGDPNRKNGKKIMNDSMSDDSFYKFLYDFYTAQGAFSKQGGAWYIWHADSEGANFRRAMADAGIMVKQCLIWLKNSMVMGRQDYQWQHEPCLYGWKEGASHSWYSDRKQTTILDFERPSRNEDHPTMKPIPLFSYQIGNSSKQGDIVGDAFGGSGTTMVACQQMGRRAFLVEVDPKYCQVIVDRILRLDPSIKIKRNGEEWSGKNAA